MPRYLILAQSEVAASALGVWLELLGEKALDDNDNPRRIVWDRPAGRESVLDAYDTLVRRIELAARGDENIVPLDHVTALVDAVRPSGLSAVEESGNWENLVALLILTFPEIRWVFGVAMGEDNESCWTKTLAPHHNLASLLNPARRDPLFDPTGLRRWVRVRTAKGLIKAKDDLKLPRRRKIAAAIDEEKSYAYLHGYTAYRFGWRADVVTTWQSMKDRFGEKDVPHVYWLLLEDMSLNFPDREKGVHLLRLEETTFTNPLTGKKDKNGRAHHCPQLDSAIGKTENSEYRILVTTGQTRTDDVLPANRAYLQAKARGKGKIVLKPTSGMFDLWQMSGLFRHHWEASRRKGTAPGYCWPLGVPPAAVSKDPGHGAPGRLLLVAEALCRRAERMLRDVASVEQAVQGAVLATDALELTGGRTPTTATDALSLKHQFEAIAECQFSGVQHHFALEPRLAEIHEDMRSIGHWFQRGQWKTAILNAEMTILNRLVLIFREYGRFDEEWACMVALRRLHRRLQLMKSRNPINLALNGVLRYAEFLISSFGRFVAAMAIWLAVLTVVWFAIDSIGVGDGSWAKAVSGVWSGFFGGNAADGTNRAGWPLVAWSCLAVTAGFFHLGVFVSYLYTLISRK